MKPSDAINKIKELLNFKAEDKFEAVKTVGGDQLKWEGDLAVGVSVVLISEEGELPAPSGDYEMEDGSTIVIEDGLVTEIKEAEVIEEEVEVEAEVELDEEVVEEVDEVAMSDEDLNALFDFLFGFKTQVETIKSENTFLKSELITLKAQIKNLEESPAGDPEPTYFGKNNKEKKTKREELAKAMADAKK
jgi:hypothetical protein